MLKRSVGSLVDQVLLSALNFGIAFALIQGISKSEYGLYVQLSLFGLLASSIADALLGNAFNILNNRISGDRPKHLLANSYRLSWAIAAASAVLGSGLCVWLTRDWLGWADRLTLALVYGIYLLTVVSREFKRVCFYLTDRWRQALVMDATYAGCSVLLLGTLWWMHVLTVTHVFMALTVSSAVAAAVTQGLHEARTPVQWKALLHLAQKSWSVSSWALPGVIVGWSINNAYLFVLSSLLGASATAEVNASKLAIMPLALSLIAWHQVTRADISRLAQTGGRAEYKLFVRKAALLMYAPMVLYVPLFVLIYPWIEPVLAGKGYVHMGALIGLWFVSAALTPCKFLGNAMLVGFEAFKPLFQLNVVSLVTQTVGVYVLASHFELPIVLLALIAADLLEMAVMWLVLMPRYLSVQADRHTASG